MPDASEKLEQPRLRAVVISSDADVVTAGQEDQPRSWRDRLIGVAIITALGLFIY